MEIKNDNVLVSFNESLATVTLNRPDRKNAITGPLNEELAAAFEEINQREEVKAVLLHGADGSFCSGLDLKEHKAEPPPSWLGQSLELTKNAHKAIFQCPVPIIGALERFAINGGAALALACDLLVVGEKSYLHIGEIKIGMAAPMNLVWLFENFSPEVARQLVLTGRKFFGPELQNLGVALDVVPDNKVLEHSRELAQEISSYPASGIHAMKRILRVGSTWEERADKFYSASQGSMKLPPSTQV